MEDFYCDDFYWAVSCDGLARGLFVLEKDAVAFYEKECVDRSEQISLWRINGGFLCMPAIRSRA